MSLKAKLAATGLAVLIALFGGAATAGALSGNAPATAKAHAAGASGKHHKKHHHNKHHKNHGQRADKQADTAAKRAEKAENHGICVSAVARSSSTRGEEHGDAVSAMAKSDCGKTANAASNRGQGAEERAETGQKDPWLPVVGGGLLLGSLALMRSRRRLLEIRHKA